MSCLVDALKKGSSYELVENFCAQFVVTAKRGNIEVAGTREEVLVRSVKVRSHFVSFQIYIIFLLFVNHFNRNAAPNSVTRGWVAQAHHLNSLDFEERGVTLWTFIPTWEKDTFRRVAVTASDLFSSDATHELPVLGSVVFALGSSAFFCCSFWWVARVS